MLTKKENFFETVYGGRPDRLVNGFEAFASAFNPAMARDREGFAPPAKRGDEYKDLWGTTYVFPEYEPGPMPIVTAENKVIKDITRWKEQLVIPDYDQLDLDWSGIQESFAKTDRTDRLTCTTMACGLFERTHYLMGFEDALMNLLLYPEDMHDLLDALLENRIQFADRIIDGCSPDVIIHHDDWGSRASLFMSPDVWREMFKERYRILYKHMMDRGVFVVHHGDSFHQPIVKDMAEIGIRVWQGAIPANDILEIRKELQEAGMPMTLMGGIAADRIDVEDWTEAAVRAETRRACETYGPGGGFIPSLTYGGPVSIYPGVNDVIVDEVNRYNQEAYGL